MSAHEQQLWFAEFRLEPGQGRLWRGTEEIRLTPKSTAVLAYLAARPGRLVSKQELFDAVWPETVVSDAALKSCIKELRQALGETADQPRYIATFYKRGYRFIGEMRSQAPAVTGPRLTIPPPPEPLREAPGWSPPAPTPILVGRTRELEQLHACYGQVLRGQRQMVFVTGEAGIGKTTVVSAFVQAVATAGSPYVGYGQCVEQYGVGEAYRPVLGALSQIGRGPSGEQLTRALLTRAPSWLGLLPGLVAPEERAALQTQRAGRSQDRQLHELAEALEGLSATRPVILVLEDLHWSDSATLAFLSVLARRSERARVVVLGTYRPVELVVAAHPLRQLKAELQAHGLCQGMPVEYLTPAEVQNYVEQQLGGAGATLTHELHVRSGGNPLFLVNLVEHLQRQHEAAPVGDLLTQWQAMGATIPKRVQGLIEIQMEGLGSEEQAVLEVGSVAGARWTPSLVAVGLQREAEEVERVCEQLARRGQFVQASEEARWPDGTVDTEYEFRHALYQEVLSQRVAGGRRRRLHQAIGERLETAYGVQAREMAAELAMHFAQGHVYEKAVQYYQQAGENALRRSAHQEAVLQISKGLELVERLPPSAARFAQQLTLQTMLAPALMTIKGHSAVEVEQAYLQAKALCEQVGDSKRLFSVLLGLFRLYNTRGDYAKAHEYGEACLVLATEQQNPTWLLGAHYALGTSGFYQGALAEAQTHTKQGMALYAPEQHSMYTLQYGFNPAIGCLTYGAVLFWLRGYPNQAQRQLEHVLRLALELAHPYTLAVAHTLAAVGYQLLREELAVATQAEAGVIVATKYGLPFWVASGTFLVGWGQVCQGKVDDGIEQMRSGLASMKKLDAPIHRAHFLTLLAEATGNTGGISPALLLVDEALTHVATSGERFYEAEIYRLKGELTLRQEKQKAKDKRQKAKIPNTQHLTPNTQAEAEACFLKAIDIAQQQQAKSLELRAAMSLARLWQRQGKTHEAHPLLANIYHWFTEGFGTQDLQDAQALLAKLA